MVCLDMCLDNLLWSFHNNGYNMDIVNTLWLFSSSPWYRWPIEIGGLPIKNGGSFDGYVK